MVEKSHCTDVQELILGLSPARCPCRSRSHQQGRAAGHSAAQPGRQQPSTQLRHTAEAQSSYEGGVFLCTEAQTVAEGFQKPGSRRALETPSNPGCAWHPSTHLPCPKRRMNHRTSAPCWGPGEKRAAYLSLGEQNLQRASEVLCFC